MDLREAGRADDRRVDMVDWTAADAGGIFLSPGRRQKDLQQCGVRRGLVMMLHKHIS